MKKEKIISLAKKSEKSKTKNPKFPICLKKTRKDWYGESKLMYFFKDEKNLQFIFNDKCSSNSKEHWSFGKRNSNEKLYKPDDQFFSDFEKSTKKEWDEELKKCIA